MDAANKTSKSTKTAGSKDGEIRDDQDQYCWLCECAGAGSVDAIRSVDSASLTSLDHRPLITIFLFERVKATKTNAT